MPYTVQKTKEQLILFSLKAGRSGEWWREGEGKSCCVNVFLSNICLRSDKPGVLAFRKPRLHAPGLAQHRSPLDAPGNLLRETEIDQQQRGVQQQWAGQLGLERGGTAPCGTERLHGHPILRCIHFTCVRVCLQIPAPIVQTWGGGERVIR